MTTALAVKEKPIIFTGESVRAILDGRKTQTRRVIKPQPSISPGFLRCPYGQPGDRLWVKETFAECFLGYGEDGCSWGVWHPTDRDRCAHHRADVHPEIEKLIDRWRPSIFMPRWASRLTLEITQVRVQRVQEISDLDINDEGIAPPSTDDIDEFQQILRGNFQALWDSIKHAKSNNWNSNPWVWAISFKVVKP